MSGAGIIKRFARGVGRLPPATLQARSINCPIHSFMLMWAARAACVALACNCGEIRRLNRPENGASGAMPRFWQSSKKNAQTDCPFLPQPGDTVGIKIRAAIEVQKFPAEQPAFRIKGYQGWIAVYRHNILCVHGVTPFASSHLRTLATAPLSVFGEGCGR